jgi:hypothetical protein
MSELARGGCLCGALRFEADAPAAEAGYCHCRLCQRSTGAPVLAYVSFPAGSFRYVAGAPARFASSSRGTREFCARCGTQIAFRGTPNPGTVDVNAGALDDPGRFPPQRHIHCASAIPWLHIADNLPRFAAGAPRGDGG